MQAGAVGGFCRASRRGAGGGWLGQKRQPARCQAQRGSGGAGADIAGRGQHDERKIVDLVTAAQGDGARCSAPAADVAGPAMAAQAPQGFRR